MCLRELFETGISLHPLSHMHALNLQLHVSGVCVFSSMRLPAFAPVARSLALSVLYFSLSVPFCLRLLSLAQVFVLLGSETTK